MNIQEKHEFLRATTLDLGEAVGDEQASIDGGKKQAFQFGNIYFNPNYGTAFECHGLILQAYLGTGEEVSALGYPISDELDDDELAGGRMSLFDCGEIHFDPAQGASVIFYPPQIAVKIVDEFPFTLSQGETFNFSQFSSFASQFNPDIVAEIGKQLPEIQFGRLYDAVGPKELQDLVDLAREKNPDYMPPVFENFLEVVCPAEFDARPLVWLFGQLTDVVESAWQIFRSEPAAVSAVGNPEFAFQQYLAAAPLGVGAPGGWATGADGSGVRLIDLEHAWLLPPADRRHEDHPTGITLLRGINRFRGRGHGTAVLGVIGAVDNDLGVVGLAPNTDLSAMSPLDGTSLSDTTERVASLVVLAGTLLQDGDILLIEVQLRGRATELDRAVFNAVELVTKAGRIVVQPAGNIGADLDPEILGDSGAVLVGACDSNVPHNRWVHGERGSNFGQRLDCWAWGERVHTTGSDGDPVPPNSYFEFTGTSAAAAIIAGCCALIQHAHTLAFGENAARISPPEMREILRAPSNCTPVAGSFRGMPNLKRIVNSMPF